MKAPPTNGSTSGNDDWSDGSLADLCSLVSDQCDPAQGDHKIYVGLEHIDSGAFALSRHGSPKDVVSAKNRFKKNDILYGKLRPYLDKAVVAQQEGICSTDILVFRPREKVCPLFVLAHIHSKPFVEHAVQTTHGVNHPRTSWAALKEFQCAVPPFSDQEKIASVLWKIQKAVKIEDAIVRNTRDLKKSLLRRLFIHGLRGEPLKETEIGQAPRSWTETTLGEVCSDTGGRIQTGPFGSQLHASDYQADGVPVVNPTHLADNKINHEGIPLISQRTVEQLARHELQEGDILFARRGEIGRHGLVGPEESGWLCGTGCFLVRIKSQSVHNKFVSSWFSTEPIIQWLNAHAAGAIMPNLNNIVLSRIPLLLPEIEEQREITDILQTVDRKIDIHEAKKRSLQALFKTTLHKLMTAQIRVNDLDIDTSEVNA